MLPEYWYLVLPLVFLLADVLAKYVFVQDAKKASKISFVRVTENVQAHLLNKVSAGLVLLALSPVYYWLYANTLFKIPTSYLSIFAVVVLYDLSYYWYHRALHTYHPLWLAHVVHHQPESLETSLALRDSLLSPLFNWVLVMPFVYLGFSYQAIAVAFIIHTFYQYPQHNHWFPSWPLFERVFVSPSLHRVHHGKQEPYLNKNYSNMFVIWDRVFGTFQAEVHGEVEVGVKEDVSNNIILANLFLALRLLKLDSFFVSSDLKPVRAFKLQQWMVNIFNISAVVCAYYWVSTFEVDRLLSIFTVALGSIVVFALNRRYNT